MEATQGADSISFSTRLRSFDRRRRLIDGVRDGVRLLALGSIASLIGLSILWWTGHATPFPTWALVPLLLGVVPLLVGWIRGADLHATAVRIDRSEDLRDLVKTAEAIVQEPTDGAFEALTVRRADDALQVSSPREALPWSVQGGPVALSLLAPLLIAIVVLSHRLETQQLLAAAAQQAREAVAASLEDLEDDPAATVVEEEPLPELAPETLTPEERAKLGLTGEPTELSELAELAQQLEIEEALQAGEASELAEATAEELREMLENAQEMLGDDLIEDESRRQEEAGMDPAEPSAGDAPTLSDAEAAPEGGQESQNADSGETGGELSREEQSEQMEVPSPTSAQMERSEGQNIAGEETVGMDLGAEPSDAQPTSGEPSEGDAAGSFGDSTAPQGEEVTPFGEATEMPVTLEIAILEAQKEEQKVEGEKRERASEAQESTVRFRAAPAPKDYAASTSVSREPVSWLRKDLVRDYFLKLDAVLEAEAERERNEEASQETQNGGDSLDR